MSDPGKEELSPQYARTLSHVYAMLTELNLRELQQVEGYLMHGQVARMRLGREAAFNHLWRELEGNIAEVEVQPLPPQHDDE